MSPRVGETIVRLGEVDSTSDEAAQLAARGAAHGTVVVATAQRRGRGRQGRAWFSPPGDNLYLSCVLRPQVPPARVPPVTLAAGVAVAEAAAALGAAQVRLKWPNDVLAGGRKLAGVLTEMTTQGDRVEHVILGVGVNVATTRFPEELAGVATSIALERGRAVAVDDVLEALLPRLDAWLVRYFAGGVAAVAPAWTSWSGMAGAAVEVEVGGRKVRAVARGLAGDGALEVVTEAGEVVRVTAGDVALVRSGE